MSEIGFDPGETFPKATHAAWEALARETLAKVEGARSPDGVPVKALYTRGEAPAASFLGASDAPLVRSRITHPDPREANRQIKEEIAGGAGAVLVVLDEALRSGDFARPAKGGVVIRSVADLATLFEGIDPQSAHIDFATGASGAAFGQILGELQFTQRKELEEQLRCELGTDPIGAFAAFGTHPGPVEETIAAAAGLAAHVDDHVAGLRVFRADATAYNNAGAAPHEEIAAALATGVAYLRALTGAGMALPRAAGHLAFTLTTDTDFLVSMAKLRAFRRCWMHVCQASGDEAAADDLRLGAATSPRMMAERDVHTNLLRTTIAAAAAILGGATAVTVLQFSACLGSSALARRLARNTGLVLLEEAHLGRVADPAAGSFALEVLTDELAGAAWKAFQEIEGEGGIVASLMAGKLQARIAASAEARRSRIANGELTIVGITKYAPAKGTPIELDEGLPAGLAKPPQFEALAALGARPAIRAQPLPALFDDAQSEPAR